MATKRAGKLVQIHRQAKLHPYVEEWIAEMSKRPGAQELTDSVLAGRLGMSRENVWKWRTKPQRLDSVQLARLADAIGLDNPKKLFQPPQRPSIDAELEDASDDLRQKVADIVQTLMRTGT